MLAASLLRIRVHRFTRASFSWLLGSGVNSRHGKRTTHRLRFNAAPFAGRPSVVTPARKSTIDRQRDALRAHAYSPRTCRSNSNPPGATCTSWSQHRCRLRSDPRPSATRSNPRRGSRAGRRMTAVRRPRIRCERRRRTSTRWARARSPSDSNPPPDCPTVGRCECAGFDGLALRDCPDLRRLLHRVAYRANSLPS